MKAWSGVERIASAALGASIILSSLPAGATPLTGLASCLPGSDDLASFARPAPHSLEEDGSDDPCAGLSGAESQSCARGRSLFFSKRISSDGRASCASCHDPAKGFRDGRARPSLRGRALDTPRTPSLLDVGRTKGPFFWNGRARSLSSQIFWPLFAGAELDSNDRILAPHGGAQAVSTDLATFLARLRTSEAPFDRFARGDCSVLGRREAEGARLVLTGKNCTACHAGVELRGASVVRLRYDRLPRHAFLARESSYSSDAELADSPHARRVILGSVPQTLRNLVHRGAPWGRFGGFATLEAFLKEHAAQAEDPSLRGVLSEDEVRNVAAFLLIGLRSDAVPMVGRGAIQAQGNGWNSSSGQNGRSRSPTSF